MRPWGPAESTSVIVPPNPTAGWLDASCAWTTTAGAMACPASVFEGWTVKTRCVGMAPLQV